MTGEELDALMAKDAAWFREHPSRGYHLRPYVIGEFEIFSGAKYSRRPTAKELRLRAEAKAFRRDLVADMIQMFREKARSRPFTAIRRFTATRRTRVLVFGKDPAFMLHLHTDETISEAIRDFMEFGTVGVEDIDAPPKRRHRDRRQRHR